MDLFRYAIKSVTRNPARNLFVASIVTVMSVFTIFSSALFEGKNQEIENAIMKAHVGRWQILDKNYFFKNQTYPGSELTPTLKSVLIQDKYSPELLLETTLLHNKGAQALTVVGIDEIHEDIFPLKSKIVAGHFLSEKNPWEVVVGEKFYKKYDLALGEDILVTYQNQNKALITEALKVVGVYRDYGPAFEERTVFLPRSGVAKLMGVSGDRFHRLTLMQETPPNLSESSELIRRNWKELKPELHALMKFHEGVTNFMIMFMLAVAYVSIITPVHLMWDARTGEINMLKTVGAGPFPLFFIGFAESVILSVVCCGLSLGVSWLLLSVTANNGLDLSFMGQVENVRSGILIPSVVYPTLKVKHAVLILCFNLATIFFSNLWCLRKKIKEAAHV